MCDEIKKKHPEYEVVKVGFLAIIIHAPKDATDEQLCEAANRLEPCGTTHGWAHVHRNDTERPESNPVPCIDDPDSMHFVISC